MLYYFDINSAYPFEVSNLPDLLSADYRTGPGYNYKPVKNIKCGCYSIVVNIPKNWKFGPFPLRGEFGKIYFPVGEFHTFIGKAGLDLIKEFKLDYKLINYSEFHGGNKSRPFKRMINKMYKMRKDPLKSLAIKLLLNAGPYGKSSESDNHNRVLPPELKEFQRRFQNEREYGKYTNFAYAAAITEGARLRLWRAAHEQGAVLLATDGIITRGKLKTGKDLGDWGLKGELSHAFILGCGRYEIVHKKWQTDSRGNKYKSEYHFRGFRGAEDIFRKLKKCRNNSMPQNLLDTKSLKQWALSLNKSDFNVLKSIKKDIIIYDEKRIWEPGPVNKISDWFKIRKISLPIMEEQNNGEIGK